ncbi:MAG: hypothetical protein VX223_08560, partial [Myxococcota bacterium]|nr:hypothetical protein [Myxococcota bacterium]
CRAIYAPAVLYRYGRDAQLCLISGKGMRDELMRLRVFLRLPIHASRHAIVGCVYRLACVLQ